MQSIIQNIKAPELLDSRTLKNIEETLLEYPYFQTANLLYIKNLNNQGSISFASKLKKHSLWVTDRIKIFELIEKQILLPTEKDIKNKQEDTNKEVIDFSELFVIEENLNNKEKEKTDPLNVLIEQNVAQSQNIFGVSENFDLESFKQTFNKKSSSNKENNNLSKINDGNTDYKKNDSIISSDNDFMTETLAKIYEKQELFDKAILIYEKLSLKFPKKSVYFADQIERLKKLINNNS